MTGARPVADEATDRAVAQASDPGRSAWVSANAGSGKTFVLARRVVRLLLAGTDPGRILCLTFTKAAAAEMAKRVFEILAEWTTLDDELLRGRLGELDGRAPDGARLAVARRLFARAVETPGGLKIQTIHAFCERLLHQFPFEANVAGYFEILDDRGALALKEAARRRIVEKAALEPRSLLGLALATVLDHASDQTYETALAEFVEKRDFIRRWIVGSNDIESVLPSLREALSLAPEETAAALRTEIVSRSLFDAAAIGRLHAALAASAGANDRAAAARLAPCLAATRIEAKAEAWLDFFTTAAGVLRQPRTLVGAAVKAAWPGLDATLLAEHERLALLLDRIAAAETFETSAAMLRLADAAIAEYERLKAARGMLDFEDLIVRTATLLARADARAWVRYKLDRGIDHILVDEAQDTNPRQWQVIEALADEFFAGEGASATVRTLFAVGDEKQSIFSFQGAVPSWFRKVERALRRKAVAAGVAFEEARLRLSFRSVDKVLDAVDKVFEGPEVRRGVSAEETWPGHVSARRRVPGRVVIWPMVEPAAGGAPEDWAAPLDSLGDRAPEIVLAERIARTVRGWLDRGERLDATGAPIRPGNILVLSRSRGAQTDAINRALKSLDVPVAGADRLALTDHIAVMDLMALGRVMLLPDDDLSLAAVLRSPLIGLSEDALFRMAHARTGSLWTALGAADDPAAGAARARLEAWRALAGWRDPFAFFAEVLGPGGGRQAFFRRLSMEAEEVLDEFLAEALAYERTGTPSLQGFLAWLDAAPGDIKRDADLLRDEVRVMTVHGAKGLEAEIVFLVDTGSAPNHASHDPCVVTLADDPDEASASPLVWMRSRALMPAAVQARVEALRDKAREEYRRLLYVAMTRAKDRLYVCGTQKRNTDAAGGWHALVRNALEPECVALGGEGGFVALEWRPSPSVAAPAAEEGPSRAEPDERSVPAWATTPAPPAAPATPRVTPSSILDGADGLGGWSRTYPGDPGEAGAALARGLLVHRLLEALPSHPPGKRRDVALRFLAAVAPGIDRDAIVAEIAAILDDSAFAPVFAPGSRGEVEIAGRLILGGRETAVSGRIDRLAVSGDRVLVVDYKTDRNPPERPEAAPPAYLAQLALYRRLLAALYPGKKVVAALLWTTAPRLMEIPPAVMAAADSRLDTDPAMRRTQAGGEAPAAASP